MKKVDLKLKVMGKERFIPAKDCSIKIGCLSKGECLRAELLEGHYQALGSRGENRGIGIIESVEGVFNCSHPDAKRLESKIKNLQAIKAGSVLQEK